MVWCEGLLIGVVHEIGVYVHSCVIQDIIMHNPLQRYMVAAVLLLPVVHFTVLLVSYNKGMATFQGLHPKTLASRIPKNG